MYYKYNALADDAVERGLAGFVDGDRSVISEVNRKAVRMGVLIVALCVLIYFLVLLTIKVTTWLWKLIAGLF